MRNCDLLKKFYEEQNDLIQMVDNLVLDTVKKGSYRTSDMGGRNGSLEHRLVCTNNWVQLKIFEPNVFDFEYSMDINFDSFECCQFFGEPNSSGINFGFVKQYDTIWIEDLERLKVLQYPIAEEQYFQYLTLFDMSSEDLYKFFVGIKKEHQCNLQFISVNANEGISRFYEILNDISVMKKVRDDLRMIEFAIRRTAGL